MIGESYRGAWRPLLSAMGLALLTGACVDTVSNRSIFVTQPNVSTQPRVVAPLPDVSVRKCIDDGFELVAVYNESGVPERYVCVDRQNGRKCESWAYYRGECALGRGWNTFPDSSTPPHKSATGFESKCGSNGQAGKTKQHNQSVTGSACSSEVPSHGSSTGSPGLKSGNAGE